MTAMAAVLVVALSGEARASHGGVSTPVLAGGTTPLEVIVESTAPDTEAARAPGTAQGPTAVAAAPRPVSVAGWWAWLWSLVFVGA